MNKVFKLSNSKEISITESKLKTVKSLFGDINKYNISEIEQIAYLDFVCDLLDLDIIIYLEYPYRISEHDILISELNKMIKSLPKFHFDIINGYYGFTIEPIPIDKLAEELNISINILLSHKNEIMTEFKQNKNYLVSYKIAYLKQEIKYLKRIKKGICDT